MVRENLIKLVTAFGILLFLSYNDAIAQSTIGNNGNIGVYEVQSAILNNNTGAPPLSGTDANTIFRFQELNTIGGEGNEINQNSSENPGLVRTSLLYGNNNQIDNLVEASMGLGEFNDIQGGVLSSLALGGSNLLDGKTGNLNLGVNNSLALGNNNSITGNIENSLAMGSSNSISGPTGETSTGITNFALGINNSINQKATESVAIGLDNSIFNESTKSFALGSQQLISNCENCGGVGNRQWFGGSNFAYSLGASIEHDQKELSLVLGFGAPSINSPLESVGNRSVTIGTSSQQNLVFNTFNIRPPSTAGNFSAPVTGIGTTTPSAKLEIQNKGGGNNNGQALSVLNSGGDPLFNVREDGWTGFSGDPSAPYYFTETSNSPAPFTGGEGKANIVQDLGGFPLIDPENKWISVGERPPDNNDNQIAYGYAATWDNYAGNFFLDDVNQNGVKDLTISFQDAGVTDPDNANNRMRFIARDGDRIFQSGAFNELMSLYPEGEVAVGDYSDNALDPQANRLEIKTDRDCGPGTDCNDNGNEETIMEVLKNKNTNNQGGDPVFTVRDNGNVGIGEADPDEKLVVDGVIAPAQDNQFDLGRGGNNNPLRFVDINATGSIVSTSDKRMKNNIDSLNYGLEEIMELRPVNYMMKGHSERGEQLGLIAQEVDDVIKEVVKTYDGEMGMKGIRYSRIIPVLINGIKEQQKQVQKQQDEIKELQANLEQEKAENEALEEKVNQLSERVNQLAEQVNGVSESFKKADDESLNQKTATLSNEDADQAMLLQNRPNPYSNETVIPYYLPENAQNANMLITNTQGQMLKRIPLEGTGKGELTLQTADLNKGQYQYTLIIDGRQIQTRKMLVK